MFIKEINSDKDFLENLYQWVHRFYLLEPDERSVLLKNQTEIIDRLEKIPYENIDNKTLIRFRDIFEILMSLYTNGNKYLFELQKVFFTKVFFDYQIYTPTRLLTSPNNKDISVSDSFMVRSELHEFFTNLNFVIDFLKENNLLNNYISRIDNILSKLFKILNNIQVNYISLVRSFTYAEKYSKNSHLVEEIKKAIKNNFLEIYLSNELKNLHQFLNDEQLITFDNTGEISIDDKKITDQIIVRYIKGVYNGFWIPAKKSQSQKLLNYIRDLIAEGLNFLVNEIVVWVRKTLDKLNTLLGLDQNEKIRSKELTKQLKGQLITFGTKKINEFRT